MTDFADLRRQLFFAMPVLSAQLVAIAWILLLRTSDSSFDFSFFMRTMSLRQTIRSAPVFSMHGARLAAEEEEEEDTEEDDAADDVLLTDETEEDDAAEDIADEEDSAKVIGIRATAADAATIRERDFFIRKRGRKNAVA